MSHPFQYIDLTYLESISDGNIEIRDELIAIFLEQLPEFTLGATTAFAQGDWQALAAIAHKAKSSVLSMGMTELGEQDLKNIELISKQLYVNQFGSDESESKRLEAEKHIKSLLLHAQEKQQWIKEHAHNTELELLIHRFLFVCQKASAELNQVISK